MDTSKDEEDIREEEIREVSPRRDTKTPSKITQKNYPKRLIIGNKSIGVCYTSYILICTSIAISY